MESLHPPTYASSLQRLNRETHRKSRNGCAICKQRKIKCDEGRPACQNCIKFRVGCVFPSAVPSHSVARRGNSFAELEDEVDRPRKRRPAPPEGSTSATNEAGTPCSSLEVPRPASIVADSSFPTKLTLVETELLLHFTARTGPSLVTAQDVAADELSHFWAHNVPMIGLSHHYVLHLALALAARHMLHLGHGVAERRHELSVLADQHLAAGLAGITKTLPHIDQSNCGPHYVSALLIHFASLADGPSGPEDLLLSSARVPDPRSQSWIRISRGVRSIMDTFSKEAIFLGLTEPLGRRAFWDQNAVYRATCVRKGFPRLDWAGPMRRMRQAVESGGDDNLDVYASALDWVSAVYEATYGLDDTGRCEVDPVFRYFFIWIYHVDDGFITLIQSGDSRSLLILAYYAIILMNFPEQWYLHGWTKHLLSAVRDQIAPDWSEWLQWPLEAFEVLAVNHEADWNSRRIPYLTQVLN